MATRIQVRRDTAANWTSNDPTLAQGEIGFEHDQNQFKIGDGTTAWTSLSYAGGSEIGNALSNVNSIASETNQPLVMDVNGNNDPQFEKNGDGFAGLSVGWIQETNAVWAMSGEGTTPVDVDVSNNRASVHAFDTAGGDLTLRDVLNSVNGQSGTISAYAGGNQTIVIYLDGSSNLLFGDTNPFDGTHGWGGSGEIASQDANNLIMILEWINISGSVFIKNWSVNVV